MGLFKGIKAVKAIIHRNEEVIFGVSRFLQPLTFRAG